jgi:transcriptional regulator with XRE-family HTH domain
MRSTLKQADTSPEELASKVRHPHTVPSEVFRHAVRALRKRRRERIADLAERAGLSRSAMSRIESGGRPVTLDEAVAIAASLGASPLHLLAPTDATPVKAAPKELVNGHVFRAWLRGTGWVRPDDVDYIPAEVDEDQWWKRCDTSVKVLFHAHRELLESISDVIDPASESAAVIEDCMQKAEASIAEFADAYAERSNHRPLRAQRVRKAA